MKIAFYAAIILCATTLAGYGAPNQLVPASGAASATSRVRATRTGAHPSKKAQKILAQAKVAMGGTAWAHIQNVSLKGTMTVNGLSGSFSSLRDISTGRSVLHADLYPLQVDRGFDGRLYWNKLPDGYVSVRKKPKDKKMAKTEIYKLKHGWWFPERYPATVNVLPNRHASNITFQVLEVSPKGGDPFELWINAQTHLIQRFVFPSDHVTYLSDYHTVDGAKVPFQSHTIVTKNGGHLTEDTQVRYASINLGLPPDAFSIPKHKNHALTILRGNAKATIPFKFVNGQIRFPVKVKGKSLYFVLDSGGGNALGPTAAKTLGLQGEGSFLVDGEGSKDASETLTKVKSVVLGGKVKLANELFAVTSLPFRAGASGAIGLRSLMQLVVRIDYANDTLTFIKPSAFQPSNAGTPLHLVGQRFAVKGSINGASGAFIIDTGNSYPLILAASFSHKNNLYTRLNAGPTSFIQHGYNGAVRGRIAHNAGLALGNVTVNVRTMALSTANKGMLASKRWAGLIGNPVLRHFTVTLDYPDHVIYLKRIP